MWAQIRSGKSLSNCCCGQDRFHLRNEFNLLPINNRVEQWEIKLEPPYHAPLLLGLSFTPISSTFSPWAARGGAKLELPSIHCSFSLLLLPSHTLPLLQRESLAQKTIPHKLVFALVWTAFLLQLWTAFFHTFWSTFPEVPPTQTMDSALARVISILELTKTISAQQGARSSKEARCLLKIIQYCRLCYWNWTR